MYIHFLNHKFFKKITACMSLLFLHCLGTSNVSVGGVISAQKVLF